MDSSGVTWAEGPQVTIQLLGQTKYISSPCCICFLPYTQRCWFSLGIVSQNKTTQPQPWGWPKIGSLIKFNQQACRMVEKEGDCNQLSILLSASEREFNKKNFFKRKLTSQLCIFWRQTPTTKLTRRSANLHCDEKWDLLITTPFQQPITLVRAPGLRQQ